MSPADRTADAVRANASAVANAERMRSTVDDPRTTPLADPCALAILLDGDERRSSEATIDATTTAGPPTERHRSVHPTCSSKHDFLFTREPASLPAKKVLRRT